MFPEHTSMIHIVNLLLAIRIYMNFDLTVIETDPMTKNQKAILTGSNKCTA